MKYAIGFLIGVVATSIFFTLKLKKITADTSEAVDPVTVEEAASEDVAQELPEDFETFYLQFHQDSLYQIKHILFPLRGLPNNADSLTLAGGDFHWEQASWRMHKPFDNSTGTFNRSFSNLNNELITEDIYMKEGFGMSRRFMKSNGEWFLIYYAAMNKIGE